MSGLSAEASAAQAVEVYGTTFLGCDPLSEAIMQSSLYVGLSAQMAVMRRLDTIADNVANMNTPGYRASGVHFAEEVAKAGDTAVSFASAGGEYISTRNGALIKSDNSLDFAIQGHGWFGIRSAGGVAYTRDGRMEMSENGELHNVNGDPFLDAGGAPLILDPAGGPVSVARDGMITQGGRQIGAIGLFDLDAASKLDRVGASAVRADQAAIPILEFDGSGIVQGCVEGSNVDPVLETTRLVSLTRSFDDMGNALSESENSLKEAIKILGGG